MKNTMMPVAIMALLLAAINLSVAIAGDTSVVPVKRIPWVKPEPMAEGLSVPVAVTALAMEQQKSTPKTAPIALPKTASSVPLPVAATKTSGIVPAKVVPAEIVPVAPGDEQTMLRQGFYHLQQGEYVAALSTYQRLLREYPDTRYKGDCHYWMGEARYLAGDFEAAIDDYQYLITHHAKHRKVTSAALRIGFAYQQLEAWKASRSAFKNVISHYPNTTAMEIAQRQLKNMGLKGLD